MENDTETSNEYEEDYHAQNQENKRQELLKYLPEWLRVLREFYFQYIIKK